MVEDDKWMTYFGAKPEIMYVSQEAYDKLQEMIAEPPDPAIMERFREILNRKTPFEND
jgi:PHD/YefM family antitoxin component YafN of YafNO toxin-antitoxin module